MTVIEGKELCNANWGVIDTIISSDSPGRVTLDVWTWWWTLFVPFYKRRLLRILENDFAALGTCGVEHTFIIH